MRQRLTFESPADDDTAIPDTPASGPGIVDHAAQALLMLPTTHGPKRTQPAASAHPSRETKRGRYDDRQVTSTQKINLTPELTAASSVGLEMASAAGTVRSLHANDDEDAVLVDVSAVADECDKVCVLL